MFPLHMEDCDYQRSAVGLLFGIFGFCWVIAPPLFGSWSDKVGRTIPLVFGLLVVAVALSIPLYLTSFGAWVPIFILLGLGGGGAVMVSWPLIADAVRAEDLGVGYGFHIAAFSLGYLVGPWVGGVLAEAAGMRMSFHLGTVVLVIGAFLIWLIMKRQQAIIKT